MKTKVKLETEKEITLADLNNNSHVGFYNDNGKGFILHIGDYRYRPVYAYGGSKTCNMGAGENTYTDFDTVVSSLNEMQKHGSSFYNFDTRKELYQWLAE